MKITGIILAGGKSSRMGQDKGLMMLDGRPMVQHIINVVKLLVDEIIIIANNTEYRKFDLPVYEDLIKDQGPLAGIYSGLNYSKSEKNIILSCDAPFVSKELISYLIKNGANHDVTIPKYDNKTHQLIGVYSKSCLATIKSELDKGQRKIKKALSKVNLNIVDGNKFDKKQFANLNAISDLTLI